MGVCKLHQAWWQTPSELETYVLGYSACLGSTPAACDLEPFTPGLLTQPTHQFVLGGGPLNHSQRVCVTVVAENQVGLVSANVSSNCSIADGTPPVWHVDGPRPRAPPAMP